MNRTDKLNLLADNICSNRKSKTFVDCYEYSKSFGGICENSPKCIIDEKSDEQLDYILSNLKNDTYLLACPGSGKTEVIGIKAAYEINNWKDDTTGMAILSFTKNSAKVISQRIDKFKSSLSGNYPHFVGTVDSWLHQYIAQPYGHLITGNDKEDKTITLVDEDSGAGWLNGFKCKSMYTSKSNSKFSIFGNNISYDNKTEEWQFIVPSISKANKITISSRGYYYSEQNQIFVKKNKWFTYEKFIESLEICKNNFLKQGFATYKDMECIAYLIVVDHEEVAKRIASRFSVIIIDESQDLSWSQIELLKILNLYGSKIHLVGDKNQAIYGFRKVNPIDIETFINGTFKLMSLNNNYRSGEGIVKLCNYLSSNEAPTSHYETTIDNPCVCYTYKSKDINKLPDFYSALLIKNGLCEDRSAILARGWALLNKISGINGKNINKKQFMLASIIETHKTNTAESLRDVYQILGYIVINIFFKNKNTLKGNFYKPSDYESGIKWRLFLSQILNNLLANDGFINMDSNWSDWCKNARVQLKSNVIKSYNDYYSNEKELTRITTEKVAFSAPTGLTQIKVSESLDVVKTSTTSIRRTTIHQIKGETLESVLLVSTQKDGEGYWKKWFEGTDTEVGRMAYVGFSRPRDLLILAIPEKDKKDISLLSKYGIKYMGDIY